MKFRITILALLISISNIHADEGMWIPLLLEKYTITDMQEKGFKLTAEDIYSINQASLKDAIIIFGRGCTGEIVSDEGLVFTNHHCGYGYIQSHSSVEKDYLTNGFWAMTKQEELPNENISATFLVRMEDVTKSVLKDLENDLEESERQKQINTNIEKRVELATTDNNYSAVVKPFYYGNEYYMFVYETYTDVRLVGAPPESIGNYGKDFDNWMWPRHTGDFSVFRIYAGENNQPADYSPDNVPYKPKKFLPISLKGVEENDFTMVMGYPGSTTQYFISDAVELYVNKTYPKKIDLRTTRLNIMEKHMKKDDRVRIQYASKFRRISNSWKKWQGIINGIKRSSAIKIKLEEEAEFTDWVNSSELRKSEYGSILGELKDLYADLEKYILVYDYASEALMTNELMNYILNLNDYLEGNKEKSMEEKEVALEELKALTNTFFKDYNKSIDKEIYVAMLKAFNKDISVEFYPEIYADIQTKYSNNYLKYVEKSYQKSKFTEQDKVIELLNQYPKNEKKLLKIIRKEGLFKDYQSFAKLYMNGINTSYREISTAINQKYRIYLQALMEMNRENIMYPDANFTMRISYGEVEGYDPRDGVEYEIETQLSGIIEKYNSGLEDYIIPEKLLELYYAKDYGNYADSEGDMPVCFVASNHTSGGNSGSPVINAEGHLIGLNFDRNWEGTMSDIHYDKSVCRNITVDVRYVLFIIDKFAGAGYLIDEMEIIR